jgi:hypothetical protein
MRKTLPALIALTALTVGGLPLQTRAQTGPGDTPGPSPYRPGLGDLMTMTVQPRHIKLWAGGQEKNWAYAAYALEELEEALERIAKAWPKWRSHEVADMISALTKEPIADLEAAIKASDATKFADGYRRLTEACNSCHQAAEHGMIVIRVPQSAPFPDQDFRPVKR